MTKVELEARQRTAVRLVGGGMSYRKAAKAVGAAPSSVCDWVNAYAEAGNRGLNPKPEGPRMKSALDDRKRAQLAKWLRQSPRKHGFATELWTLSRGFMLQPLVRRTWAPAGCTPPLVPSSKRDRWSVLTALTLSPQRQRMGLYFHGFDGNVRTPDAAWFVQALLHRLRRPLHVIWDGLNVHKAAARWLRHHYSERTVFERLPAYAPQLNPVEYVWSHTKRGPLANFCADDFMHMGERLEQSLLDARSRASLLRSFFVHAGLDLP